jgi:ATP-dependent RNA helicase DDX10/DBP4
VQIVEIFELNGESAFVPTTAMAPSRARSGGDRPQKFRTQARSLKRKREDEDLDALTQKVVDLDARHTQFEHFTDLPLSQATQKGLAASHFKTLTTIQSKTIPLALQGSDILGAAKTGSGKTLAFLVPVLENLGRKKWTAHDGVGALILSPTRELAIQIFDVLRQVGRCHTFSAGLVIGGKSLQEERDRLGRMNILVATPGRMLQHMDQTADLDIGNLQMLVLDEADRIMDMGFSQTIDALIEHLPKERQTLMFSATQTKKVSDLARLSLKEPEFVSVHENADSATPSGLQQNYVVTPLPDKLDTLWSFIRANVKKKILVFLSSGKQVRFVYEAFRHLQPGIPLLHLHGRQKQTARLDITTKYSNSKAACLFSTDVAARGLDFPSVDWVVQLDAPEDPDTYIHRVGRTARFEREGRAVMFLDPSEEEGMLAALERKKVTLEKINVRQKKMQNTIKNQLQNMCFKDPELKYLGQKAFVSYVRSVHVQKDKETFNVKKLDLEGFAASLGLPGAPRVKFVKGEDAKARKNAPRALIAAIEGSGDDDSDGADPEQNKRNGGVRTKYDRMFERQNQGVLSAHYMNMIEDDANGELQTSATTAPIVDEEDDFLAVKRRFQAGDVGLNISPENDSRELSSAQHQEPQKLTLSANPADQPLTIDSNRRARLLTSKKGLLKYKGTPTHLTFSSDDETPHNKRAYAEETTFTSTGKAGAEKEREDFVRREGEKAKVADQRDKEVAKNKKREKIARRKERERAEREGRKPSRQEDADDGEEEGVQLVPYGELEDDADGAFPGNGPNLNSDDGLDHAAAKKRPKKWFEDESSDANDDQRTSRKKKKLKSRRTGDTAAVQEPQTLEDLEAMASGLLTGS